MTKLNSDILDVFKRKPGVALSANDILTQLASTQQSRSDVILAVHDLLDNQQLAFTMDRLLTVPPNRMGQYDI